MDVENEIFIDDDLDILDILEFGFPRRIYVRSDYFDDMDNLTFYRRFRLTKQTVERVLGEVENDLEVADW